MLLPGVTDQTAAAIGAVTLALHVVHAAALYNNHYHAVHKVSPLRISTFLLGCIWVRATLTTLLAMEVQPQHLPLFGAVALLPAIGWMLIFSRVTPRDFGPETLGGRIWWNNLRPVHAALWTAFALGAFAKWDRAWMFLAADTALGLAAWMLHQE
jgi:hypothetical protein